MKHTNEEYGDAYHAVRMIYDKSPGRSWRRLNTALQDALTAAITAHLSFLPGDFNSICRDMKGGYWMGHSEGSTTGERYYNLACKVGHTPACISFESFAGRPAALWTWDVKTPERLRIGSDITWEGVQLTVSNLRTGYLIACSYGPWVDRKLEVGSIHYFGDGYRSIQKLKVTADDCLTVSLSAKMDEPSRKPTTVVKISYDDLAAARKLADKKRKHGMAIIEAAETEQEMAITWKAMEQTTPYRPCDTKAFREALDRKLKGFREKVA